jgi:hypothetical protein
MMDSSEFYDRIHHIQKNLHPSRSIHIATVVLRLRQRLLLLTIHNRDGTMAHFLSLVSSNRSTHDGRI